MEQCLGEGLQSSKIELVKAIEHGVQIFDPERKTCPTDWLKIGVGYWLQQKYCNCISDAPDCCKMGWKVTLTVSHFLQAAEQRYAPVEGESLTVTWARGHILLYNGVRVY